MQLKSASGWKLVEFIAFHTIYLLPIRGVFFSWNSLQFSCNRIKKSQIAFELMYQCQPSFLLIWIITASILLAVFSLSISFSRDCVLCFYFGWIHYNSIYCCLHIYICTHFGWKHMKCSKNAETLLFMKAEMDRDNGADVLSLLRIAIPTSKFQLILCYFFSLFFFLHFYL